MALGKHGTRVRLHLREKGGDEEEDPSDFLEEGTIRAVVRRYSDFVAYPIQMESEDSAVMRSENSLLMLVSQLLAVKEGAP